MSLFRALEDPQKSVLVTTDVIQAKKKQSTHLMMKDSAEDRRLRAVVLTQTYSVSRIEELVRWNLSDLYVFEYGTDLPGVNKQPIRMLYSVMATHKNLKVWTLCNIDNHFDVGWTSSGFQGDRPS